MKIALLAALALVPLPVAAQSLDETHELVWHPAGKSPMLHYRLKDRASCAESAAHHQAGKAPLPARNTCIAAAKAKTPTRLAAVDRHPLTTAE